MTDKTNTPSRLLNIGPHATAPTPAGPLNGIPATPCHDEGAIARCSHCGRYSIDPSTLRGRSPQCECGEKDGWCGSFAKPGPDAKWSGGAPAAARQTCTDPWIVVSDRLPAPLEWVLAHNGKWTGKAAFFPGNDARECWQDERREFVELLGPAVTHWMALPAAPGDAQAEAREPFQARVQPWMLECFGPAIAADRIERNHRFLEEALELVQALGCTAREAHQLVDYTFGRPVGEASQEVGGVMVTLAAVCLANTLDMHAAGETELARISAPAMVEKIRAKQAAKPKHSPLPAAPANAGEPGIDIQSVRAAKANALRVFDTGDGQEAIEYFSALLEVANAGVDAQGAQSKGG
ncbi:DUF551 domain-containing protein [Burkholderia sp. 22PA0099]|uniref:DUF551 domain-containing protein n=1 Tax=Burkholderia sp. 22PA0099 TaxID=3237372 RepID=UPI0039C34BE6